ncbi:MAG TPA: formate/nitrite transporter family protein [Ktedonobacterales bacterium]|nr:formate/nitrite transporter family protein [Ktedonobacterales bacterium]
MSANTTRNQDAQSSAGAAPADEPDPNRIGGGPGLLPELSRLERKQVAERVPISAAVVHETVREEGERELARHPTALAFSGLAAGLSMGFSMVGEGLLLAHIPNVPWRPAIAALGYSLGFVIVVLGRQQLFTENTLTAMLPLLAHPDWKTFMRVARLWGIVLLANLLGAFIFATIVAHTPLFPPEINAAFATIGHDSLRGDFGLVVLRGVFAGWLIALMIWLLPVAQNVRLHIIILLTYTVALGGFAHIIAGSVDVLYLVSTGAIGWGHALGGFIVPTLLGNILGGVALVAALNYAQVASESLGDK